MKKTNKYFNELMLIALIAFIPMSMLSCSVESVENVYVINDSCMHDYSIVGQYESYLNTNIIYTFGIDNWHITQDDEFISDRFYCVTEDSNLGVSGYIKVEQNGNIDYFSYYIVYTDSVEGIVIDGMFYQKL